MEKEKILIRKPVFVTMLILYAFITAKMLLKYQKYDTIDHPEESVVEPELQVEHEEEA